MIGYKVWRSYSGALECEAFEYELRGTQADVPSRPGSLGWRRRVPISEIHESEAEAWNAALLESRGRVVRSMESVREFEADVELCEKMAGRK